MRHALIVLLGLLATSLAHADIVRFTRGDDGVRALAWFPRRDFLRSHHAELRVDGVAVEMTRRRTYVASSIPVAVVWVIGGDERSIRDHAYRLRRALEDLVPGALPAGSSLAIVSYAEQVKVQLLPTLLRDVPDDIVGSGATFRGVRGGRLSLGVSRALDLLERSPQPRKVMMIFGDGADERVPDVPYSTLRMRAHAAGIEIVADTTATEIGRESFLAELTNERRYGGGDIREQMAVLARSYEVEFPTERLPFDGELHRVELVLDGQVMLDERQRLPLRESLGEPSERRWLLGIAALGGAACGWRVRRRRAVKPFSGPGSSSASRAAS